MTRKRASRKKFASAQPRTEVRIHGLRHISVNYEGRHEQIVVKPPDLSPNGMFISTTRIFPEGAVLNLRFQLEQSGAEIETRSEVRYCLPGVGVGVEFIGISAEDQQQIAREIQQHTQPRPRLAKKSK